MNEKRIQQVLDIEKQAQALYDAALNDAKQLPIQADQEAQMIIDKARVDAENEARQILAKAHSTEESDKILAEAQENINRTDALAKGNFSRAVTEVLNRVVGKE